MSRFTLASSLSTKLLGTAAIAAWKSFFLMYFTGFPSLMMYTKKAAVSTFVTAIAVPGRSRTAFEAPASAEATAPVAELSHSIFKTDL